MAEGNMGEGLPGIASRLRALKLHSHTESLPNWEDSALLAFGQKKIVFESPLLPKYYGVI
jgi:hypothetical protein